MKANNVCSEYVLVHKVKHLLILFVKQKCDDFVYGDNVLVAPSYSTR